MFQFKLMVYISKILTNNYFIIDDRVDEFNLVDSMKLQHRKSDCYINCNCFLISEYKLVRLN